MLTFELYDGISLRENGKFSISNKEQFLTMRLLNDGIHLWKGHLSVGISNRLDASFVLEEWAQLGNESEGWGAELFLFLGGWPCHQLRQRTMGEQTTCNRGSGTPLWDICVTSSGQTSRKYLDTQVWGIKRNLGWRGIYGNCWHTDYI